MQHMNICLFGPKPCFNGNAYGVKSWIKWKFEMWNFLFTPWIPKTCSSCKLSQFLYSKWPISLCSISLLWNGNIKHHWKNNEKRCQVVTSEGFLTNLFNGKHQAFCTSQCNVVGMQECNHGQGGLMWKAPRRRSRWVTKPQALCYYMGGRVGG